MKKTTMILALLMAAILCGQIQAPTGQIKATYGNQSVILNLTVYTPPTVEPITCDATIIAVGRASNCVYTVLGPAPVPITVLMVYGVSVTGPSTLTIPAGNTTVSFVVTGVSPTAVLLDTDGVNSLGVAAYQFYEPPGGWVYSGEVHQLCVASGDLVAGPDLWGC